MSGPADDPGGWAWWQARRLRYNLALAGAGSAAYGAAVGLAWAMGRPFWRTWQDGVSMTLALGAGYLILMGVANLCFLLGPLLETWLKPADTAGYRRSAFALGFWSSAALPFAFPTLTLAMLLTR